MKGTLLLARTEIMRLRRNRRYMMTTLAIPIVFYLLIGKSTKSTVDHVNFAAYYMVAMATFGSFSGALMGNAIRIATERKDGWIRQLRLTPLPPNSYVIGKLAASMAITVPSVIIVLLLGRFYGGVHLPFGEWIAIAVVVWLGAIIFTALAVAIGYRYQPDQAQPIAMLIYFVFLILGGIFFPLGGVLQNVASWTPTGEAIKIATDVVNPVGTVSAWLVVGMVLWLGFFSALAWASVRATAETV
jgi:ABC-2 type transport system permease protein